MCFGVPVDGLVDVFCDNKSIVNNLSIPTSFINNIHNYICYYTLRKSQAVDVLRLVWIPGEFNLEGKQSKDNYCW